MGKERINVDKELKKIAEKVKEEYGFRSIDAALTEGMLKKEFQKLLRGRKRQEL